MYVTYIDGCCAFYRVESVLRSFGNKLFIDELFGYYDDTALGLMLWNRGYKLIVIPEVIATHVRNLSFGKEGRSLLTYLGERNRIALSLVTNTRYKHVILFYMLKRALASAPRTELGGFARLEIRALFDGINLGMRLSSKSLFIDLYKAPLVEIPLQDVWKFLVLRRLVTKYFEKWFSKNLSFLVVE
jgi:GT2 family glycosyltransferase